MPINRDKNVAKNITLSKETAEAIQKLADSNKRSFSNQAALMLEQLLHIKQQ